MVFKFLRLEGFDMVAEEFDDRIQLILVENFASFALQEESDQLFSCFAAQCSLLDVSMVDMVHFINDLSGNELFNNVFKGD